ncbi:squalene epoxidase-domain-containing protein [Xylaria nigripes]|nr:squalene epoxidase-domain-containing protein [Xylaria nigripes]
MALHDYADDDGSITYDVLIVGAGIVGSVMAILFARQGRRVLVIERDMRQPERIVGEVLQPGGVTALQHLGLGDCLEGIDAQHLKGYQMCLHGEEANLWYPPLAKYHGVLGSKTAAALQEELGYKTLYGLAFHNGRLVSKLREKVLREENVRVIEATVVGLLLSEDRRTVLGVTSRAKEGSNTVQYNHTAHLTVIADGKGSSLRSQLTNKKPFSDSKYYAITLPDTKFKTGGLSLGTFGVPLASAIYSIDSNDTRIMIHIPDVIVKNKSKGDDVRDIMLTKLIPTIPPSLRPVAEKVLTEGRWRSVPNSFMPPCANDTPGVVLLGDALNMRHPVSGAGMTVGFQDAIILKELLDPVHVPSLKDHAVVQSQLREFSRRRKPHSLVLNVLAQLMCLLISDVDGDLSILQHGFVGYASSGNPNVEVLSALLCGMLASPWTLVSMFMTVSMFSMRLHLQKQYAVSVWLLPLAFGQCLIAFAKAGSLVMPYVLPEFMA